MPYGAADQPSRDGHGGVSQRGTGSRGTRRGVVQAGFVTAAVTLVGPDDRPSTGTDHEFRTSRGDDPPLHRGGLQRPRPRRAGPVLGCRSGLALDGQETLRGLPAWREGMVGFFAAFPDATYTLDDLFVAGDKAVWRGSWHATQRGVWEGIAASGREVSWTVIIIGRFADGKLVEDWVEYDRLGLFQQLGAIPVAG